MAGYWPSSFFCVFMDGTKSRSINSQKKRTRPISSHLDRANLVNKGFIIWLSRKFFLAGYSAIRAILPARGASHIINSIQTR